MAHALFRLLCVFFILCATAGKLFAFSLVRDDEWDQVIRAIARPVIEASPVAVDDVEIYLIDDPSINAFVMGGTSIFIHTGMLYACTDAAMIQGVIAHELGHISGGHIPQTQRALQGAAAKGIGSILLGAGALLAGSPDLAMAVMIGGNDIAIKDFLSYRRHHESAADQAAITLLHTANQTADGLQRLLHMLYSMVETNSARETPYLRSHPLTEERLDHVSNAVRNEKGLSNKVAALDSDYRRMVAKIYAFLHPTPGDMPPVPLNPDQILYYQAIQSFRAHHYDEAKTAIDRLIATSPNDSYAWELKAQIAYSLQDWEAGKSSFKRALSLNPTAQLMHSEYVGALLAQYNHTQDAALLREATHYGEKALALDQNDITAMYFLSVIYGRLGDINRANYYLALREYALGNAQQASLFVKRIDPAAFDSAYRSKYLDLQELLRDDAEAGIPQ